MGTDNKIITYKTRITLGTEMQHAKSHTRKILQKKKPGQQYHRQQMTRPMTIMTSETGLQCSHSGYLTSLSSDCTLLFAFSSCSCSISFSPSLFLDGCETIKTGVWFDKSLKKNPQNWVAGLWSRGQSPLNLLDVSFWRIYRLSTSPQTRKLEIWTRYRLLL